METRDLDYLLEVQRCGGIGKAAEALGMSQPALTKAIKRIESEVGLALFHRSPNGVVLTPGGIVFVERARRIALEYEDALKELRAIQTGEQGILRVGYSPTVPDSIVLRACRQLMNERPAARLRLRRRLANDLFALMSAGELDMAVAPEPPDVGREFATMPLFNDRLYVMADESHPLQRKARLKLRDLVGEEWLLPGMNIPLRRQVNDAFRRQGLPEPALRVETDFAVPALLELLRGSRMLCIAGNASANAQRGLVRLNVDPGELELGRSVGAIVRAGGYVSPLAQRLVELLQRAKPTAATVPLE
ncbi:DNA-binding transcriptional LysR family regulator [Paraburkholderia bannensis]|uniref:DNA-binding transcriptional LysR family regulator n=1 Tax=Paraburkholderia bannensis TaxID=765414 RepID=A0A7W9WTG7_9BURK|nr:MULTISPECIES: LysR family transcriptional regulator [Paraburkholderia]MBB3260109.1 DNA-binding transcriptional LysR family regulator [Paraburkholderia sp. WP4_3_2]MBB6105315.1 DNA-binding transcriptional LysR family regulator [Paraburkholderia bannensis]